MKVLLLEERINGLEFVLDQLDGVGNISYMLAKDITEIPSYTDKEFYEFCLVSLKNFELEKLEYIRNNISINTMLVLVVDENTKIATDLADDILSTSSKKDRIMRLLGLSKITAIHKQSPKKIEIIHALREMRRASSSQQQLLASKY